LCWGQDGHSGAHRRARWEAAPGHVVVRNGSLFQLVHDEPLGSLQAHAADGMVVLLWSRDYVAWVVVADWSAGIEGCDGGSRSGGRSE